jgi:tetratricopeptide (TPR) repeat protein
MTLGRGPRPKSWTLACRATGVLTVVALFGVASLAASPRGWAQEGGAAAATTDDEKDRRAKDLYEQGNTHYDLAEYDQAIDLFKQAYALSHRPTLLYNIAQAYRLKGDCEQALQVYRNYLRVDPGSQFRAKVESRIAEMETCVKDPTRKPVGKEAIQEGGGGSATEGKGAKGTVGHDVVGGGGGGAAGPSGAGSESARGGTKKLFGLVAAGVGVAAIGTGVYFSLQAKDKSDQVAEACPAASPCDWNPMLESLQSDGQSAQTTATVLYVVGGAAIAGGVVLYILGANEASAAPQVAFVPRRGGGSLAATWSF